MSAKALLSASVSAPPAVYIEDTFSTFLYTGNGSTQTITNGIDLSGEGGLVWIKKRSSPDNHVAFDTGRGNTKQLIPNLTNAESTDANAVTSFNSSGFSLGSGGSGFTNTNGDTYASWTFRKAAKFFDVVTWTGNATNRTIAHNLGSVPGCIFVKKTSGSASWNVYHRSTGNTNVLFLNLTDASAADSTRWNNTTPTATEFSLGTSDQVNQSGATYVAYVFAHDAGGFGTAGTDSVVKCGSFTGSGAGVSTTINLGYEPQFILAKRVDAAQNWIMVDTMRGLSNTADALLYPNLSNAESSQVNTGYFTPTATGFVYGPDNYMGDTAQIIYIAIRRGPMKTPTVGTEVFSANTYAGGTAGRSFSLGFAPDALLTMRRTSSTFNLLQSRLTGINYLRTYDTTAEVAGVTGMPAWDANTNTIKLDTATSVNGWNVSGFDYVNQAFRRAPGFFDVVAYTGTSSARTVSHNLGVAPELMIVKSRSRAGENWVVYHNGMGAMDVAYIFLNQNFAKAGYGAYDGYFSSTAPSSSVFSLGTDAAVNFNTATYIAYLFATAPGVSKVGNYTGTGTTKQIDCGFTAGARFVLIKRADSTGDWYTYDTARGIISGNDSYLLLNSAAAEVTNTDYIDPLSSGFEISSTAPAAINANGGSFIYLAVA